MLYYIDIISYHIIDDISYLGDKELNKTTHASGGGNRLFAQREHGDLQILIPSRSSLRMPTAVHRLYTLASKSLFFNNINVHFIRNYQIQLNC